LELKNITVEEIGLAFAISQFTSTVTQPLWGRLSDRYNRKTLLVLLSASLAFLYILIIFASNIFHFIILGAATFTFMMASGSVSAAFAVRLTESGEVGRSFSRWRISWSIGWIIATLFSGLLTDTYGFPIVFVLSAVTTVFSILLFKNVREGKRHPPRNTRSGGWFTLHKRGLLILYASILLTWVATAAIDIYLPLYLHGPPLGASNTLISIAFSFAAMAEIPGMLYFGSLSDKIGRKRILSICFFAYPLRLLLTAMFDNPLCVLFVQLLHSLTFGGLYVVSMAYVSDTVPNETVGTAVGFYTMAMNFGLILGAPFCGALVNHFGFKMMYKIMALYSVIPATLFVTIGRETLPSH